MILRSGPVEVIDRRRRVVHRRRVDTNKSTFVVSLESRSEFQPCDVFAKGGETGNWLAALDDFRNWLIREAA